MGPGTELKKLLASLGIMPEPGCPCIEVAAEMDRIGTAGVIDRRDEFAGVLRTGAKEWGWWDFIKVTSRAVTQLGPLRLDLLDPYGSLVDEACRRAAAKGK